MTELGVEQAEPKRKTPWGVITAAVAALLAKGKGLLALLKVAGLGKFVLTFGSAAVMVAAEAARSGPTFAVGFVGCILIHELGHAVAIREAGLQSGWPVFIPFVGAFITLKGAMPDAVTEARIGIAGPVAGAYAALGCVALHFATGQRAWLAVAATAFVMNLFNLTPLRPLDGGRVAALFSRRIWMVGAAILVAMMVVTRSPVLVLIAIAGLPRAFRGEAAPLEEVPAGARAAMAARYFGLCAFLGAGFYFSHRLLG